MTWSKNQQTALAIIPKFSAFMSLLGSGWIILEVLFNKEKRAGERNNVYSRLLLGMSTFELLESMWNFQSTWPIPKGTEGVFGASGNTQTCVAQGFFLQLGLAVPMYNAFLSIYYLLVIKYNISDVKLQNNVEPFMHVIAILLPLATCIACLVLDLFNNANLWCWIAPYPLNCNDSARYGAEANCIRGDNAWIYRWAFYFGPLWSCIITAILTMIFVYKSVRAIDERTLKYRKPQVTFGGETTRVIESTTADPPSNIRRESNLFVEKDTPPVQIEIDQQLLQGPPPHDEHDEHDDGKSLDEMDESSCKVSRTSLVRNDSKTESLSTEKKSQETTQLASSAASIASGFSISTRVKHWNEARSQRIKDLRRSHDVFQQALWYLAAFLVTHLFSTINRSLQLSIGHTFFPLLVLHSFFDPFQGFLNFLVYRRPRYLRHRRNNLTRLQAMHRALRWTAAASAPPSGSQRRLRISALSFGQSDRSLSFSRERSREMSREMSEDFSVASHSESIKAYREEVEEEAEEEKQEITNMPEANHPIGYDESTIEMGRSTEQEGEREHTSEVILGHRSQSPNDLCDMNDTECGNLLTKNEVQLHITTGPDGVNP